MITHVLINTYGLSTLLLTTIITIVSLSTIFYACKTQKGCKTPKKKKVLKILFVVFLLAGLNMVIDYVHHVFEDIELSLINNGLGVFLGIITIMFLPLLWKNLDRKLLSITAVLIFFLIIQDFIIDMVPTSDLFLLSHFSIMLIPYITGYFLVMKFIISGEKR